MSITRLRSGEILALLGALLLIGLGFAPWYGSTGGGTLDGWDVFGASQVLLALGVIAALALVLATLTERTPAIPIAAGVWSTFFSLVGLIGAILALAGRPEHASGLKWGSWVALAASLFVLAGSWQSLRDERVECYHPTPPEPRAPRV